MRKFLVRTSVVFGICVLVAGAISIAVVLAKRDIAAEAAEVKAKNLNQFRKITHGGIDDGPGSELYAACDKTTGNLIYSSGYGLAVVPGGCM